jgi:hypothetical protein
MNTNMTSAGRSRVPFPMRSVDYSTHLNFNAALKSSGRLRLEQKWVPEIVLGVKGGRCMLHKLGSVICNLSVTNVSAKLSALFHVTRWTVGQHALLFSRWQWMKAAKLHPSEPYWPIVNRNFCWRLLSEHCTKSPSHCNRRPRLMKPAHTPGVSACDHFYKCEYRASVGDIWKLKWHEL